MKTRLHNSAIWFTLAASFIYILPKTMVVICGYIILLGLTGAATVTPVSGLCRQLFGTSGVTIFYGAAFFAHQVGGFLSAWLGGVCFEQSGGYFWIWITDAVLCTAASIISFLISV